MALWPQPQTNCSQTAASGLIRPGPVISQKGNGKLCCANTDCQKAIGAIVHTPLRLAPDSGITDNKCLQKAPDTKVNVGFGNLGTGGFGVCSRSGNPRPTCASPARFPKIEMPTAVPIDAVYKESATGLSRAPEGVGASRMAARTWRSDNRRNHATRQRHALRKPP